MIDVLADQMQTTRSVRQNIIDLVATMVNQAEPVWSWQAQSWAITLAGAAVASISQPVPQKEGCKILSVFGQCKEHKAKVIESLHQSLGENRGRFNLLSAETETVIFALDGKADATQENLRLLNADAQTNSKKHRAI